MQNEKNKKGFTLLVLFFVRSIALFIFSLNIVRIYLGWDGLGVTSYALVIYYERDNSLGAGILTVLRNRVGDFIILFCISFIFSLGNWDFVYFVGDSKYLRVSLILARITKRAQMPFSAWLPAAIAAPTPVSALVHSSTLVTAGVYLLIRFNLNISSFEWFFYLSSLTGLIAGLRACWEADFKKIVALSTLSQLRIIIVRVSLGLVKTAFFHLIRHAYFKALLFICVGLVIHSWGSQDAKMLGLSRSVNTLVFIFILISSFSLIGLFFIRGFYSKDLVFEKILSKNLSEMNIILFASLIGFSASYCFRLIQFRCTKESDLKRWSKSSLEKTILVFSIRKLGILSIFGGWSLNIWVFFSRAPLVLGFLKFFIIFFT